jgi:hypothetical protein
VNSIALSLVNGHALLRVRLSRYHECPDDVNPCANDEMSSRNSSNKESKEFYLTQESHRSSVDKTLRALRASPHEAPKKASQGRTTNEGQCP